MKDDTTQNTKHILYGSIILGSTLLLSVFAMIVVGVRFLGAYENRNKDQARYECAVVWRVEVKESDEVTGSYPSEQGYAKCLHEKGIK